MKAKAFHVVPQSAESQTIVPLRSGDGRMTPRASSSLPFERRAVTLSASRTSPGPSGKALTALAAQPSPEHERSARKRLIGLLPDRKRRPEAHPDVPGGATTAEYSHRSADVAATASPLRTAGTSGASLCQGDACHALCTIAL